MPERQAFEELLEQIQLTERLGFDEAWFAEHHHSDYGMLAWPNLIIANLAPRTQRLRFGNLVNVLPLYDPMRLAEECGMLDILTGGRLKTWGWVAAYPEMTSNIGSTAIPLRLDSKKGSRYYACLDRGNLQLLWQGVEL